MPQFLTLSISLPTVPQTPKIFLSKAPKGILIVNSGFFSICSLVKMYVPLQKQ